MNRSGLRVLRFIASVALIAAALTAGDCGRAGAGERTLTGTSGRFVVAAAEVEAGEGGAGEHHGPSGRGPAEASRDLVSVDLMQITGARCAPGFAGTDLRAEVKEARLVAVRYRDMSRRKLRDERVEPATFDALRRLVGEWNPAGPKVPRQPTGTYCGFRLSILPFFDDSSFDWKDSARELPHSVAAIVAEMYRLFPPGTLRERRGDR